MNFGERLKKILDELDVSQNELSRRTDKESSYISKIINGKVNVSWSTIQEFADALNISPGQFFANENEMVRLMMQELPTELVEWLRQRESIPYLLLAKEAFEEGFTVTQLTRAVELLKELDKKGE